VSNVRGEKEAALKSLTVVIPAYNEAENIGPTCLGIAALAEKHLDHYEILVFDDASTDATAEKVRELERSNPKIRLIKNAHNRGLGFNYCEGVRQADCRYVMMVPGDNEVIAASLEEIFRTLGTVDIGICYAANSGIRPPARQLISKLFTSILNMLFGLKVLYFNGPNLLRTDLAKTHLPDTSSFAYMAVMLVTLLKEGHSFQHYTFELKPRLYGKTKAFCLQNVLRVMRDVLRLFWSVHFLPSRKSC
jgi:glycosyltransferase involved in cell wall biosynthesis